MADQPAAGEPSPSVLEMQNSSGPWISGTTHRLLRLGQRIKAEDLVTVQRTPAAVAGRKSGGGGGSGAARRSVTLLDLLGEGIIVPGKNKISVSYKGQAFVADLVADGTIDYQGRKFNSPTAFSIWAKRLVTPGKQGDDGWKSVLYEGLPMEHFRDKWLAGAGGRTAPREQQEQQQQGGPPGEEAEQQQAQQVQQDAALPAGRASGSAPVGRKTQAKAKSGARAAAAAAAGGGRVGARGSSGGSRRKRRLSSSGFSDSDEDDGGGVGEAEESLEEEEEEDRLLGSYAREGMEVDVGGSEQQQQLLTIDGQLVVDLPPGVQVDNADQWVQCDRCKLWRLVPNDHWQAVQDDPREEWYCEYAVWPVADQPPHEPPCTKASSGGSGRRSGRR